MKELWKHDNEKKMFGIDTPTFPESGYFGIWKRTV